MKRILKALFALFFGQILSRFGSFVLVPLFTKYWTPTVYGEWITLSATVGYIASLDFGVNQAAINKLTQSYAAGNLKEYRITQHSALKFYSLAALGGFIIIALLLGILPLNRLLGIVVTKPAETAWTLAFLSLYILTSLPAKIIFGIYQTTGNLSKTQWINNIQNIFFTIAVVLIIIYGQGMLYVAILQYMLQIIAIIYVLLDVKIKYPDIIPGIKLSQQKIIKELFKPGLLFTLVLTANIIWMQGSVLLISATMGGLMVAVFSVSRTLALLPRQIVSTFYAALFPDIAIMSGQNDYLRLRMTHKLLIIIPTGISVIFFSMFWFYGEEIISLWTLGEIKPDILLLRLLLLLVILQTPYLSSASITLATNKHKRFTFLFFTSQLIGLVSGIVFLKTFGIYAVPICFIACELIFCYYFVIKDTCNQIGDAHLKFFFNVTLNSIIITLLMLTVQFLIFNFIKYNFIANIVISLSVNLLISILFILLVWLNSTERNFLLDRMGFIKKLNKSNV
jgi:O-antigen/teichoic acid export membrane protein